jgi:bifunctional DNA-binding transcriptional regulator/antitoxin component of YhaV-PrlF toxin-antitoxin module
MGKANEAPTEFEAADVKVALQTVGAKAEVVIPRRIRQLTGIHPHSLVYLKPIAEGTLLLQAVDPERLRADLDRQVKLTQEDLVNGNYEIRAAPQVQRDQPQSIALTGQGTRVGDTRKR